MTGGARKPLLLRLLARLLRRRGDYGLLGDIEEMYRLKVQAGPLRARVWLMGQALNFMPWLTDRVFWRFVMFKNYVKAAIRNMRRNGIYAGIKVFGLAVGLACCMLILLWVRDEVGYDRHHENAHRVYRVLYGIEEEGDLTHFALSPFAPAPIFQAELPEIVDYTRMDKRWSGLITVGDQSFEESDIFFVDPGFFNLFSHDFISGSPEGALDDPGSVVLTDNRAQALFGRVDVVGRNLHLDEEGELRVTAVVADGHGRSHMEFDYLVSNHRAQRRMSELYTSWGWMRGWSYVLLENGVDPDAVVDKFGAIIEKHSTDEATSEGRRGVMTLQPVTDIHLKSHLVGEMGTNGSVTNVVVFSTVAVFILLIACINFMNLATARSLGRSREVGMRKVLGAVRGQLKTQFLSEAMFAAFVSLLLAVIIVAVVLPVFNRITMKAFPVAVVGEPMFWGGGLLLVLLTGLVAGSYPAFFLSAFEPVRTLKGTVTRGRRGATFRDVMVVLQFAISVALITSTYILWMQTRFMKRMDLGFEQQDVLTVALNGREIKEQSVALKEALLRHPGIREATVSYGLPGQVYTTRGMVTEGQSMDEEMDVALIYCDYDFVETFGIELLHGRNFSPSHRTDAEHAFLINEAAARAWGWNEAAGADAIGRRIGHSPEEMGPVIGVVGDFYAQPVRSGIVPMAIRLTRERISDLSMRVHPETVDDAIAHIEEVWEAFEPNRRLRYWFLESYLDRFYETEERLNGLLAAFTSIAVVVACLGLFGLAAFTAEQRTKEIGVRRVLGASISGIMVGLTRGFVLRVVWACAAAAPAVYFLMSRFLREYASRIVLGPHLFALPAGLALMIALMTVSTQAARAAMADPVKSLRYE